MNGAQQNKLLPLDKVLIDDHFWAPYQELVRKVVLPYQWEALNDRIPDAEPSHAIRNLEIAAGLRHGEFQGFFFQDSDLAKWLEAVAYSLHTHPDPALEETAEQAITLAGKAQQPDGYLNSYFTTFARGKRWTNLQECHEMYVAGHFIEAGVAWFQATGKRNLLDIVCKIADNIDSTFGPEPEKMKGYDGHQEIELALARLYEVTGEKRYLSLSLFFLQQRGRDPYYFTAEWEARGKISAWTGQPSEDPEKNREYMQTHLPVTEQKAAEGHAVRVVYMLTGMADVAMKTGDEALLDACHTLWRNIVSKQMYITGGIGATSLGEAFTFDYDLPNDAVYAETCASVGLIFFAQKMLEIESKREYADIIERALFNLVVGSMSKDGEHYFYVNPLEVWPDACSKNPTKHHVKPVRQKWFGCACCPPNLARLLASLGKYIYTVGGDTIFVNQFIASNASIQTNCGSIRLKQESQYPWMGDIKFSIELKQEAELTLAIRIPGWCGKASVAVNGNTALPAIAEPDGYIHMHKVWHNGDTVLLMLDMPVVLMQANPLARADAGKVAIQRGPILYCLEEADNGKNLSAISIALNTILHAQWDENLLGGAWTVQGEALRDDSTQWHEDLYRPACIATTPVQIKAVPYFLWGNRELGEMSVWFRKI